MGRAVCERTLTDSAGNRLNGATVYVYQPGTTTVITETIYADYTGVDTLANPLTTDSNGKVQFYLDLPKRVDLKATKTGYTDTTFEDVIVIEDPPMTTAGDMVYASTNGTPTRLAKGTALKTLRMNAGATAPEWGLALQAGQTSHVFANATAKSVSVTFDTAFAATPRVVAVHSSTGVGVAIAVAHTPSTTGVTIVLYVADVAADGSGGTPITGTLTADWIAAA